MLATPTWRTWCHLKTLNIRAIFVWPWNENARTKQKQQTNGNSLIDWFIERIQTHVAFGWLSECQYHYQWILRFDFILQHDWPMEQCLLHIRVFFGGKTKSPCFDLFIHWLMKQTAEHLPKPFFKVIRKSLYMKDTLRKNESRHTICLGKGKKSVCERYLITKLQN